MVKACQKQHKDMPGQVKLMSKLNDDQQKRIDDLTQRNRKLRDSRIGIAPLATSSLVDDNQDLRDKISALEVQLLHETALLAGGDSGDGNQIVSELNRRLANVEAETLRRGEIVQTQLESEVKSYLDELQSRYSITTKSLQTAQQTISSIEAKIQNVSQSFGITRVHSTISSDSLPRLSASSKI